MCPVAAESKNSNPSSKKKINKKINTNLESIIEEDSNNKNLKTSSESKESSIEIIMNLLILKKKIKGLGI